MTKRNIIVLLSSVLLALCVILSSIRAFKESLKNNTMNADALVIIGVIILVSLLSILIVYLSKVRKSHFEKMLNAEYFNEYEIIKDAVMNSQLSNSRKKEVKEDILDILISAQTAGKNVKEVVDNPVRFAQEIVQSFTRPIHLATLSLFDGIITFVICVVSINLLLWFEQLNHSFFESKTDIIMVVLFIIIAFLVVPLTKRQTSTRSHWMFLLPLIIGIAYVLFAEILRRFFYCFDIVKIFLDGTINMIPNIPILLIYLFSVPTLLIIKKKFRNLAIK